MNDDRIRGVFAPEYKRKILYSKKITIRQTTMNHKFGTTMRTREIFKHRHELGKVGTLRLIIAITLYAITMLPLNILHYFLYDAYYRISPKKTWEMPCSKCHAAITQNGLWITDTDSIMHNKPLCADCCNRPYTVTESL
jgi:hypothetical protein